ncbi:MAG: bifunctional glutamate N-acetyltransferase/amino-acid acetyltransferase ArgJ [Nitrospirae bacterium]|nr:bifunctional glutamate N-acetyltransferase/amino-acid acetyltransferase ArgJ [Nitrospirota bacterium]
MKIIKDGNITSPKGFLASGIYAGIKRTEKPDLSIIYSEQEATAAGVFTINKVKAPPVILTQRYIKKGIARAIVVNSGNANACTGKQGMIDAEEMAELTAKALSIKKGEVYVSSTGVIGEPLPMEKIRASIGKAVEALSAIGGDMAAAGIMTTDTFPKKIAVRGMVGGKMITVGGIAKGSGMIHPKMATMLAFITTDAVLDKRTLSGALKRAVDKSFNRITVDGDTSTNDMAICLANGMAGNNSLKGKELEFFQEMLDFVCYTLGRMIVKDGEGATKLVEIKVKGAKNIKDAEKVGFAVANSNLVKTALFAADPNWGRIMAAIGYSGAAICEEKIAIFFDKTKFVNNGIGRGKDIEQKVAEVMRQKEYTITIDLNSGDAEANILTSDLTYDYVKINVAYRS